METSTSAVHAPDDAWIAALRRRVLTWAPRHFQSFPWRQPLPLWQALVTEVLLQRTRAAQVIPIFHELRSRYPTAQAFAACTEPELAELIRPLGLHWRARQLVMLAREIGRRPRLPRNLQSLMALPGIGPYAAGAALSLHADVRAPVIDANTVRLVCRLLGAEYGPETRRTRWIAHLFERLVPSIQHREFNYGLLDLGTTICRPRAPLCDACPLADCCMWRHATQSKTPTSELETATAMFHVSD